MPHTSLFAALLLTTAGAVAIACADAPSAVAGAHATHRVADARPAPAGVSAELAELRRALAPYHQLDVAKGAGWTTAITPCWYHGDLGAMGYHYADPSTFNGTVEALNPEALVYEPLAGGKYRLVAAEYIVPIAMWEGAEPPSLFGQRFDRNDVLGIYALHVWIGRENPAGMFAAWNPKVSCQHAAESEDRGPAH